MESAKAAFEKYLKEKNIRYSGQRDCVFNVFIKTEGHLSVADLHTLVQKQNSKIGYATVARAMKVIYDAGMAHKADFGDGICRYEHKYNHGHHDHLICTSCGGFTEAIDDKIEQAQRELANRHKFELRWHTMQLFGLCHKCRKK